MTNREIAEQVADRPSGRKQMIDDITAALDAKDASRPAEVERKGCRMKAKRKRSTELAAATGSTVPYHEAKLDQVEKPTLLNGDIAKLDGDRQIEVWDVKGDSCIAIRIYSPTHDGKRSKLMFGLKRDAAHTLAYVLAKHLSNAEVSDGV